MHVKRLYRPSVREALAAARQELGADALVLSTELVPAPGWRGWMGRRVVRLTAAADRPMSDDRTGVAAARPDLNVDEAFAMPARPAFAPRRASARAGVAARLAAIGLDAELADAVAARLTETECRSAAPSLVERALAAELTAIASGEEPFSRCEVFIGPPGVGKTTTIAKIAGRERARHARTIGLIAADVFRAGAVEQLRSFAEIIGAPFRVARTATEVDDAIAAARHPVLVDTAGRSPSDYTLRELFSVLTGRPDVRTHLVIAADTSPASARRIFDRYGSLEPTRVVITKIDEAESVLPLFGVIRERGLAVSYLTAGQRVPEDLAPATPAQLAAALLAEPAMESETCH
jgi:flagellar biosynthesis protein FlhF